MVGVVEALETHLGIWLIRFMEESITMVSIVPEERMDGFATIEQVTFILTSALRVFPN